MPFISMTTTSTSQTPIAEISTDLVTPTTSVSQSSWGGVSPGNLANAVDGNLATRTDFGSTQGSGNEGNITVNLSQIHYHVMTFVKITIKAGPGWSSAEGEYTIEGSTDNSTWTKLWQFRFQVSQSEQILSIGFLAREIRYFRVKAKDIGSGQVALAIDDVSMRKLL